VGLTHSAAAHVVALQIGAAAANSLPLPSPSLISPHLDTLTSSRSQASPPVRASRQPWECGIGGPPHGVGQHHAPAPLPRHLPPSLPCTRPSRSSRQPVDSFIPFFPARRRPHCPGRSLYIEPLRRLHGWHGCVRLHNHSCMVWRLEIHMQQKMEQDFYAHTSILLSCGCCAAARCAHAAW
jgi:hypothetical protein